MKKLLVLIALLPIVALAASRERVVALGGDVTEIVYALGAQSSLVARDSTSQWPEAANALPDVGYLRQLNAEGILATRPTLVLASAQAQPSLALKQLEQSNIRVVTIPASNALNVIDEKIRVIAEATHREADGETLRTRFRQELAALPSSELNKRVLFILNHGGMTAMAAGQQTAADAAIRAAGLRNAMQGVNRYQPLSQEGVIASQPDLVVISQDGVKAMGGEDNLWAWRRRLPDEINRYCRLTIWRCSALAYAPRRPFCSFALKLSNCPDVATYPLFFVDTRTHVGRDDNHGYRFWRVAPAGKSAVA